MRGSVPTSKADREALALFRDESTERLDRIYTGLDRLAGGSPVDLEELHGIFRDTHSLKSGANLLGLRPVEQLCHRLEDLLERIRSGADLPDGQFLDILRAGYGRIGHYLENLHLLPLIDVSRDIAEIERRVEARKKL